MSKGYSYRAYKLAVWLYGFWCGMAASQRRKPVSPRRILVGATTLLGDMVMNAPLVQALERSYPGVRISMLVRPGFADLARAMKGVDEAIEYRPDFAFLADLRRRQGNDPWDWGIVALESKLIPLFGALGLPWVISYPEPKGRYRGLVDEVRSLPPEPMHIARIVRHLADGIAGPGRSDGYFRLCPLPAAVGGDRPFVVIHPGARTPTRHWPTANYRLLAESVLERGFRVVLTGGAAERGLADAIVQGLASGDAVNLAGQSSLTDLVGLFQHARLVIGPDTGVLHLAKSCNAHCVILMGPTQKAFFGPDPLLYPAPVDFFYVPDLSCRDKHQLFQLPFAGVAHCTRTHCDQPQPLCMSGIDVSAVRARVLEILGRS